jgi:tRNA-splicing ligase RtcB
MANTPRGGFMIKKVISDTKRPVKIWADEVEETALQQLKNTANMPFVFKHVAAMADVHAGKGATVGSVIATKDAIMPCAVGVDCGCGMSAVRLPGVKPEDLSGKLSMIRAEIEKNIPVGMNGHDRDSGIKALNPTQSAELAKMLTDLDSRSKTYKNPNKIEQALKKATSQMGTLGGGNHFIEVCVSENNEVWLMLHSGSRGFGNLIAQHHIDIAHKLMEKMFITLPDKDLAYFSKETQELDNYINDLLIAQNFAFLNRRAMQNLALKAIGKHVKLSKNPTTLEFIDCHHNYVAIENHFGQNVYVTRKGAVRARKGDFCIIPGSMGAKSFITKGLGNTDSFHSCSHGAGRKMSRNEARKNFKIEDLESQTQGVECRKDLDVIDEIPGAYKDIEIVMENQNDLVETVDILKQVICIKG